MKQMKNRKKWIGTVVLSALLSAVALTVALAVMLNVGLFPALADDPATTITIGSSEALINYSIEYADGAHNPNDTLKLVLSSDNAFKQSYTDVLSQVKSFVSIGNSNRPFNGKVQIEGEAINKFVLDVPLFGTVTTNVKIEDSAQNARELVFKRKSSNTDAPLFANTIIKQGTDDPEAHFKVRLEADDITDPLNPTAYSFAGAVGTIGEGAKVFFEFTHASSATVNGETVVANVQRASNIGLICGSLGEGAELKAKVTATAGAFEIRSTGSGKHAGGLVGEMAENSKIILPDSFTSVADVYSEHGYAGALVGYGVDALYEFQNSATATFSKTVSGDSGAGGLFGYLKCTGVRTFDLSSIFSDSNFTVTGSGNAGGVFGMLEAENDVTIDGHTTHTAANKDTFDRQVKLNGGSSRGGVIGMYKNSSLEKTLLIKDLKVEASSTGAGSDDRTAGIIGRIDDNGSAVYVNISGAAIKATSLQAGLIGSMGSKGSFLDVDGMIALRGSVNSGLVYYQNAGVVRLKGYTDMGGGYFGSNASANGAQLVGTRGNGLVYALGSGSDSLSGNASSGWTYRRCGSKSDDIGDWGEVLRLYPDNGLSESDFFTPNMTAHTVTLAAAVNPMTSKTEFVKTALNIQHKVSDNISLSSGALLFASGSDSTTLLSNNLSVTNNIDLSGTGITGLTRDNGTNAAFSATFEGNNKTITLAIGENYGLNNSGTDVSGLYGNNGNGTIINHGYQGLFAKASGATFQNVTISGHDSTTAGGTTYIGGLAAQSTGNLTLSGVTVSHQVDVYESTKAIRCGGAVGIIAQGSTGTVSVNDSNFNCVINDARGNNESAYFGGVIGYVRSTSGQTFNIGSTTAVTLGGSYSKTNDSTGNTYYGGLIGAFYPASTSAGSNARKVNVRNLTVSDSAAITAKNMNITARTGGAGALLGSVWPNVDVTIGTAGSTDGVTIGASGGSAPSIAAQNGGNGNIGALFYKATGKMDVNHVKVNDLSVSSAYGTSTFGFIVNDTYYAERVDNKDYKSALYLNVDLTNYDIAATSVSGSFSTAYDEIAAYSVIKDKNIEENGQAIVSLRIPSDAGVIMDGASCNTYQNQTSYATKINSNTRYYYNLEAIRKKSSLSDAEKLLMWSVYTYGHSSLRSDNCLKSSFNINTITGDCNMEWLSYYPVNASGMTISGATIKFYNSEIENGESRTGNSDSSVRSTGIGGNTNVSQHYLMHTGLFLDYTGTLTISGQNTLQGNVGKTTVRNNGSGFIVSRTLGGDLNRTTIVKTNAGAAINLDGAVIAATVTNGAVENNAGSVYAPLLINKIGSNTNVELSGVKTVEGADSDNNDLNDVYDDLASAGGYAASSLIGYVGSDTSASITLKFSNIVLDARKGTLNDGSDAAQTAAYFTEQSIFSQATLLNSFTYNDSSTSGTYDYQHGEDWTAPLRQVTYGWEVTHSAEYVDPDTSLSRERFYIDTQTSGSEIRTNPLNSADTFYDFSASKYLPYVHVPYNTTNHTHELKVNIAAAVLEEGCGKYNDPYKIAEGGQLNTIANIIQGSYTDGMTIILPINDSGYTLNTSTWHGSGITDYTFRYSQSSSKFESTSAIGGSVRRIEPDAVRAYLAGAYYYISGAITLPSDFPGLGAYATDVSNYSAQYAFRGVIVGNSSANPTITNKSGAPLIKNANGCVVKNVSVSAEPESAIALNVASSHYFTYNNGTDSPTYGALIGQVMGGDNIIDHVGVSFSSASITINDNGFKRLAAVGGYIGALVNGGVIFRNMTTELAEGLTSDTCAYVSDAGWLYVNPIIGRVIAGYAFNETSAYAVSSATVLNGNKNYDIPDLNKNYTGDDLLYISDSGITIPNGQAFYVLSCIVNSGAGSASDYNNSFVNYTGNNGIWAAYRNYTETRCGQYDEVGTGAQNAAGHDYYDWVNGWDKYGTETNKTPYIILKYTKVHVSGSTNKYYARSVSTSANRSITLTANGSFSLPAGYRGIGSIYNSDTKLQLQFTTLTGNGNTVSLAMSYQDYIHEAGNQGTKNTTNVENYRPYDNAGFGLFNVLYQQSASSTNKITGLTISGSVFCDMRKLSDGSTIKYAYGWHNYNNLTGYYPDVQDRVEAANILHVGALAGSSANAAYIDSVTLSGLSVEGPKYVGGMIGYVKEMNVTITSPSSSSLSVTAGFCAGGLVGGFYGSGNLKVTGTSDTQATISFDQIIVKGEPSCAKHAVNDADNNNFYDMLHCAGGLCGHLYTNISSNSYQAEIKYITVKGSSIDALHKDKRPNDMRYKIAVGGFFGRVVKSKLDIENCSVTSLNSSSDLSIKGNLCGGLIGYQKSGFSATLKNIDISNLYIQSLNSAGGLIGTTWGKDTAMDVSVDSLTITNSKIFSEKSGNTNGQNASAGGIVGGLCAEVFGTNARFDVINSKLSNCEIKCEAYDTTQNPNYSGVGGLYGCLSIATANSNSAATGHNILLESIKLYNNTGELTPGVILGTNGRLQGKADSKIKLVGISVQSIQSDVSGTTYGLVGKYNNSYGMFGTNGYVVFADFKGSSVPNTGLTQNTAHTDLYNSTNDYAAVSPYVTVNPGVHIGNGVYLLTGDGVAEEVNDLAIKSILASANGYAFAKNAINNSSYTSTTAFDSYWKNRFSTYNVEQNAVLTNDFAVLVLEDTKKDNTTALINRYLNLLANTDFEYYKTSDSDKFTVVMKRMTWDGTSWTATNDSNLKFTGNQFYMESENVDTAGQMFSLIDVQFKDPANTSKIAYHLYVPVIVKKMLRYDFDIATGAGTNYERAWYDANNRWGMPLMENLGTPSTVYFKYTYKRTVGEWQQVLDNGENLLRNYAKTLNLTKSNSSVPNLPEGTILVLVDPNNGCKPYYWTVPQGGLSGVLSLSAFHENLDGTGAAFTPVDLNDLLHIKATAVNDGAYVAVGNGETPTVEADFGEIGGYRPKTDADTSGPYYQLKIVDASGNEYEDDTQDLDLPERYYLSFFTEAGNSSVVYHYIINAPTSFGDSSYPSKVDSNGNAHLILGNIFEQSGFAVRATNSNEEISPENNQLDVTMTSTVKIYSDLYNEVNGYLTDSTNGINVYQSFLLYLTREDADGTLKMITGSPNVTGSYTITSSNDNVTTSSSGNYANQNGMNAAFAEFKSGESLNSYLTSASGEGAVIEATIHLVYPNSDSISEQFPDRSGNAQSEYGTSVSGSSHVGYDPDKAAYSKIATQETNDSNNRSYYCLLKPRSAKLSYIAMTDIEGDYAQLGINPLDIDELNAFAVSTIGTYDFSDILAEANVEENGNLVYSRVKCELRLLCRQDDYATDKKISDYFTVEPLFVGAEPISAAYSDAGETVFTIVLDRDDVTTSGSDSILRLPIDFSVLTGADFETAGYYYSNYKVTLDVTLMDASDNDLAISHASNYIVYTNACIYPDFIG